MAQGAGAEVFRLTQQGTWLGRSLALDELRVGIGRIDLSGYIALPSGESKPGLGARLRVGGGGRGIPPDLGPGFELINDAGEAHTNMGGGGGTIWDDGRDERQGFSANWGDQLPENFRQSERLLLRYVQPSASMVLKETWTLVP